MNRRKFENAYAFVSSAIRDGRFDPLRRLPSNAALARMAGVSRFTIWQVIDALKKEGRVVGARGHCCRLPAARTEETAVQPEAVLPVRHSKGQEVIGRIRRDILNGLYPLEAPLPGAKELTARYGVSRPTLRKAIRALVRESVLVPRGAALLPMPLCTPASRPMSRIVLLGYGTNITNTVTWGYWHQEYLKTLEMSCAGANLAMGVVCFARDATHRLQFRDGRSNKITEFTDSDSILGYIYEVTGNESADDELLQTVAGWSKPVAILDEVGAWPTPAFLRRHTNIRVFRNTVSDTPAQQVARFLLELGHRTAVYVSPHHQWDYSRRRCDSLAQSFSSAVSARLVAVTSQEGGDYVAQGRTRTHLPDMQEFFGRWSHGLSHAYTYLLNEHFALLPAICGNGRIREDLDRLLQQALAVKEATAWVMVNDDCAHYALDFLAERDIGVPERLSVISFDDLPIACRIGLSSYNFNQPAMVTAMLRYITNPRLFPARRPVVEIEGQIIPRRTTGRAGGCGGTHGDYRSSRL